MLCSNVSIISYVNSSATNRFTLRTNIAGTVFSYWINGFGLFIFFAFLIKLLHSRISRYRCGIIKLLLCLKRYRKNGTIRIRAIYVSFRSTLTCLRSTSVSAPAPQGHPPDDRTHLTTRPGGAYQMGYLHIFL